jgi:hypothetical protein
MLSFLQALFFLRARVARLAAVNAQIQFFEIGA